MDQPTPGDDSAVAQDDLRELLLALGMGDHARPQSPHEVFQEALAVLRQRLSQGTIADEPYDPLKRAVWQAILPFRGELLATGGVTFMGLRNAVVTAVEPFVIGRAGSTAAVPEMPIRGTVS